MHDLRPLLDGGDAPSSTTMSLDAGGAEVAFVDHLGGGGAR